MSTRKASTRVRTKGQKVSSSGQSYALLKLVRSGVTRFVLHDAPIGTFQKAVREASRAGKFSTHPLSGTEFRRIVKEAVKKRTELLEQGRLRKKPVKRKGAAS